MDKYIIVFIASFALLSFTLPYAAGPEREGVSWMTWEEAAAMMESQDKKVLLNVYTDWCGWCKRMDTTTFDAAPIAQYINSSFYPVRFNAERQQAIEYRGQTYQFVEKGKRGYHQFAAEMLKGRMSFPSVVFLDEEGNVIQSIVGYKSPEEFEQILTYFAEDYYKETPWSTFKRNYASRLINKD